MQGSFAGRIGACCSPPPWLPPRPWLRPELQPLSFASGSVSSLFSPPSNTVAITSLTVCLSRVIILLRSPAGVHRMATFRFAQERQSARRSDLSNDRAEVTSNELRNRGFSGEAAYEK